VTENKIRQTELLRRVNGETGEIVVLHVDDDPQFVELVGSHIEKLDSSFTVLSETDPESGLERLETDRVDCIISDFQMPKLDGIEFLREVRQEYPNLPFIMFTGKGSEEIASKAVNEGATAYFQKDRTETYELLANEVKNEVNRRRSQRLARVTKDRLFGLFDRVDGFYFLDGDWTITYWNHQMVERTGHTPTEVLGRSYWDVFPEAQTLVTEEHFREAMETEEPVRFEVHVESREYWTDVRVSPVDGGLFVHSCEITERKERQQELERRNQILESFANTVTHDLKSPLNVAEGRIELAKQSGDLDHLEEVSNAHNRMRNLIEELLRIARGEELSLSQGSLRERTEEAWATVSAEEIDLVIEDDCRFEAHSSQLRRLFENIFWNALEHGDADTVRVGTLEDGFYIEDNGVGIPPAERDEVFEAGYSTSEEGTGYGLHIVHSIVEMHDWTVIVTEGRDDGARFEVQDVTSL
jgi:PAS domain S-box-containing protein